MSSSPTVLTSTTGSSTSSPSPNDGAARADAAIIACGAIAQPCGRIIDRRGWSVDVHPLPPLLHNHPERIAAQVAALATRLQRQYGRGAVAVAYADCGTYGALDEVCDQLGIRRLEGLHCYDVYAGAERLQAFFDEQPGTYVLTDFLVRSFTRSVIAELGLDRYPDLRDTYFAHYTRVVWLAQDREPELERLAEDAAAAIGLPLRVVDVGDARLERALEKLLR
jgi:hypothetical protein